MSRISKEIRKAALSPVNPYSPIDSLSCWLPYPATKAWDKAADFCRHSDMSKDYLHGADEAQARTFLLLVAEALE
jgi:hypothetical protein